MNDYRKLYMNRIKENQENEIIKKKIKEKIDKKKIKEIQENEEIENHIDEKVNNFKNRFNLNISENKIQNYYYFEINYRNIKNYKPHENDCEIFKNIIDQKLKKNNIITNYNISCDQNIHGCGFKIKPKLSFLDTFFFF